MTKKELKVIGEKILPNLPGFVVKDQMLFLQTGDSILRAIFFDTSDNPRKFYVHIFILPLFVPASHLSFNFGFRIGGSWDADAPNLILELGEKIKEEGLPFLQTKNVREVLVSFNPDKDPYARQALAYLAVHQGNYSLAEEELNKLISLLDLKIGWQKIMLDRAEVLKSDLSRDPEKILHQFAIWEKETLKNLGI